MNTGTSRRIDFHTCESPNIFVGGIPSELSPSDVLDYLAQFGRIETIEMPRDPVTKQWKGYAKARIQSEDGYLNLLSQENHWIKGFNLGVKPWVEKRDYLARKDELNKRKLFVKFMPVMSEQKLYNYFSQFGPLESVECKHDPETKKPRNFGFVVFKQEADAYAASLRSTCNTRNQRIWCELTTPKFILDKLGKDLNIPQEYVRDQKIPASQRKQKQNKQPRPSKKESAQAFKMTLTSLNEKKVIASLQREGSLASSSSIVSLLTPTRGIRPRTSKNTIAYEGRKRDFPLTSFESQQFHQYRDKSEQLGSLVRDRSKVGWSIVKEDHHFKPTSKRYPLSARFRITDNHSSGHNLLFRFSTCIQ